MSAIQHACACSFTLLCLHFPGSLLLPPPPISLRLNLSFTHPVGSPLWCDRFKGRGWDRVFLAGGVCGWVANAASF